MDTSEDSSSDYSTDSSDEDGMEIAQINNVKLQLPQGLCERQDIFREFFTVDLWNSLSTKHKQHLQTFLPTFPENDDYEKSITLQRLFDCSTFKFNSPLLKFHDDLRAGYFRPDIARMRKIIRKAEQKEAKYRYKTFKEQLKHDVIESQRKLLNQIKNLPPGIEPKQEKRKLNVDYVTHRTKKRYFSVLQTIRTKVDDPNVSSDENYPEGPPVSLTRKQKRHLNSIRNSLVSSKERFFHTTMQHNTTNTFDLEKYVMPSHNPFYINDEAYRNLIYHHRKRKLENPDDPELNTRGITLSDIVNRTQLPYIKNITVPSKQYVEQKIIHKKKLKKEHIKPPELVNNKHYGPSSNSDSDSDSVNDNGAVAAAAPRLKAKSVKPPQIPAPQPPPPPPPPPPPRPIKIEVKKEPLEVPPIINEVNNVTPIKPINNFSQYGKITPVKVEDLEGIDMMNIPIDLDNSDIDILELSNKPELMQETHANFFSLIRDVICSTNEHRMNMYTLQERLKAWQENPISPLNEWYSLTDNWIGLLPSAITFLCGNSSEQPDDFVPYMEYKTAMDVYQWIGAGRDSDNLLSTLCTFWLDHRTESKQHIEPLKEKEELDVEISDRSQTPPPPRCPTNWTVRKATLEEVKEFRDQERRRYDNPHKAFTYRCNGYESVVGPLKGIYNPAVGNTKARGHTMLNADRPNFVTILSLVRDATARLPNGEGTRAEICELLKSSQYISSTAPDNVLQSVVSGALDRMHTQFDPCVKYDPKRKIWIYLHRNRTEEDFERIHQQYQGMQKTKKATAKKSPTKPKTKVKPVKNESQQIQNDVIKANARRPTQIKTTIPSPALVPVNQTNNTSLLISNNAINNVEHTIEVQQPSQKLSNTKLKSTEEKEINQAIQAIVQNRVASPTIKSNKSLVKILSPTQGKSLIIPTSNTQILKQIQEQRNSTTKQLNQVVTQQLLQTIAVQQKQIIVQKQANSGDGERTTTVEQNIKVPANIQQQIIQSITPQQLQNIKNVTLLRTQNQNVNFAPISASQSTDSQNNIVTVAVSKQTPNTTQEQQIIQPSVQIKTHGTLTPAQQQQILQTLKQKILPQTNILQNQQQIILKQKTLPQKQVVSSGTSLLNQTKTTTEPSTVKVTANSQGPVVAKVLTNAAGQVISVESLLAHQKQHGSLPQGTTLRVSGTKAGQQNIIHLTGSKASQLAQFTMASQNNLIALTSQPKLVVASQTTSVTSTVTTTKPTSRTVTKPQQQNITKFTPKVTQQLINAKLLQENQKIVQPKLVMSQAVGQTKLSTNKSLPISKQLTLNVAGGNSNTIRMVNAANLNLTHIGGKPVLLASKGGTIQNIQGQNVILQPNSGGTSLVLQHKSPSTNLQQQTSSSTNNLLINQQNIVFAPQVKVQQQPQVVFSGVKNTVANQQQNITQSHLVLGGQTVRLQTSTASSSTQRVVLASQGQGGQIVAQQILLPAGFQGTAINIKALQGVKVIPIAQAGHAKGVPAGRQVFARVMSPTVVKTTQANQLLTEKTGTDSVPSTD